MKVSLFVVLHPMQVQQENFVSVSDKMLQNNAIFLRIFDILTFWRFVGILLTLFWHFADISN